MLLNTLRNDLLYLALDKTYQYHHRTCQLKDEPDYSALSVYLLLKLCVSYLQQLGTTFSSEAEHDLTR